MKSTITSKSNITSLRPVTVTIGHSAPTTPKTNETVGCAYMATLTENGKKLRKEHNFALKGKNGNLLQLTAAWFALKQLGQPSAVTFVTDSKYVLDTFAKLRAYVQAGWKTRTGTDVKNQGAWKALIDIAKKGGHRFSFRSPDSVETYAVEFTHCRAKEAVLRAKAAAAKLEAKAAPAPEVKTTSSLSAKSEPAPEAAQPAKGQPNHVPEEQPSPDDSPFELPEIPELPEEALPEKPFTEAELFMLELQRKAKAKA